jgi:choice-of-anchor B domain-containing protein
MKNYIKIAFLVLISTITESVISQNYNTQFRDVKYYPGNSCANIWGYVDSLGNEYALVGVKNGTSIVDVTNPDNITEVAFIPGPVNLWKEIKTWQHYAYVTTEGGGGLQIIDLNNLPGTNLPVTNWAPFIPSLNGTLNSIHALHIDNGKVYLYGSNSNNVQLAGIIIASLSDPWNPVFLGAYTNDYVHDGYAKNDTIYAGVLWAGKARILDSTNPSNISMVGEISTPTTFTHNTWVSDDRRYMFTTDENASSFLASFDISDPVNISRLDQIQTNTGSNAIVHNTYYHNGYSLTSWYSEGFTIVDSHRPRNLVEVGKYDTFSGSQSGFYGAWGVYPYLPSGNILVTNIDTALATPFEPISAGALFVITPTYKRACYLEGTVREDSLLIGNPPLLGVSIYLNGELINQSDVINFPGEYAVGTVVQGAYQVTYAKDGYETVVLDEVALVPGEVTIRDVLMRRLTTGINRRNIASKTFVFPNPNSGFITIKNENFINSKVNVTLTDLAGRTILEKVFISESSNLKLDLDVPNGNYFLKINSGTSLSENVKIQVLKF